MPMLSNPRHEQFAQALARGASATDAYVEAGYMANDGNAARLNGNERIKARVAELQSRAAGGLVVTLQWLMEKAEEARQGAMNAGQHAAAVSAVKEIGVLSGLRVEKREQLTRAIGDMTDEELEAIVRAGATTAH